MGQLFNRMSRVVRAELDSRKGDCKKNYINEGTALVAGGAITGVSVGKVGILAGGTGFSLGTLPLAAAGALTGAALYEVLRSLLESDPSSAPAAGIGAAVGASTSAVIGGVGVAAGGSAIGAGMVSMAAGGAVVGLGLVGINRLLQQGIDPEKLLDSAIEQMETDLQDARQAVVNLIASQKRLQQQHERVQAEVVKWHRRAQLALQKGDNYLAQEALSRKKTNAGILNSLKVQLNQEPSLVQNLREKLLLLETKISEAKTMRISLKEKIKAAKANGELQSAVDRMNASSAMAAFERMVENVLQMEAHSKASSGLTEVELDSQIDMLEPDDVDEELAEMKAQLLGSTQ